MTLGHRVLLWRDHREPRADLVKLSQVYGGYRPIPRVARAGMGDTGGYGSPEQLPAPAWGSESLPGRGELIKRSLIGKGSAGRSVGFLGPE